MIFKEEYLNYLEHHGVPGMKWGVRKSDYRKMNRYQKRALKAYGQTRLLTPLAKISKNSIISKKSKFIKDKSDDYIKQEAKVKKNLEKILGTKINDASILYSAKKSAFYGFLGNPIISGIKVASRANRSRNLSIMKTKEIKDYFNGIVSDFIKSR